ncbi:MAG: hypothetical protein J1F69_04025 [Clostridiales bacterium]|nr:hypothetical protein [Clostridiales bacterium]
MMTMMNKDVSFLLNDPVVNKLADIYLSFLNMHTHDVCYRRLKNAVILSALKFDDMACVYAELEKTDDCSAEQISDSVENAINSLPEPIEQMFNNAYCEGSEIGFMPHHKTADNIVAFLGKTFLYILETNYPLLSL